MTNRQIMHSALKKYVFPKLLSNGFEGKYPDFKRVFDDYIELISFQTNKWGGSFRIETSVVFPKAKKNNLISCSGSMDDKENITVSCTSERYTLDGMFGETFFYYCDVYVLKEKRRLFKPQQIKYDGASNENDVQMLRAWGYKLFKEFDSDVAVKICDLINTQLEDAFLWMKDFEKKKLK